MATEMVPVEAPVLRVAGGIIQRSTQNGEEILVVFRKREQDWTLPKGEVKDNESFQEAALREVEAETGLTCRLGNYLGTISFADNGVPKVVMFWKMSVVQEKASRSEGEVIGESVWLPIPAAIQRLSHVQEKTLISRLGTRAAKTSVTAPITSVEAQQPPQALTQIRPEPAPQPLPQAPVQIRPEHTAQASPQTAVQIRPEPTPQPLHQASVQVRPDAVELPQSSVPSFTRKRASIEDERVRDRLLRESEAFRVELAFLERRSAGDKSWASAAHQQIENVLRCLETNDIEGGLFGLHAAQRFAVYGLNKNELITRAYILREEALKISSWRGEAMDNLLAVPDEQLTADRLADAMKLRDEESSNQYYRTRLTGDHLRILLVICSAAVIAFLPFMLLSGQIRLLGPVLLFGLLGSCFGAAQALMRGKGDSMIPNVFVMLTPVIFGGVAGLAGFGIHEYLSGLYGFTHTHWGGLLGMAFFFGLLGQRILARFTGSKRRKRGKA
jgi:8-oxo-dGTP diphosphatase